MDSPLFHAWKLLNGCQRLYTWLLQQRSMESIGVMSAAGIGGYVECLHL